MEKHDARGYFALKKNISLSVLNVLGGLVYIHLAFTEVAFTRMNSTTINADALTI